MAIQTRRLSAEAVKRLRETVEAEHACGSAQLATDLDTLLRWHDEQPARDAAIRADALEAAAHLIEAKGVQHLRPGTTRAELAEAIRAMKGPKP